MMRNTNRKRSYAPKATNKKYKQSMNVQKLDAKLRRYRRDDTEFCQYQHTLLAGNVSPVSIWNLTKISGWVKRFGPDPSGVTTLHKIDYDFQFKAATEPGPTTCTAFLVTLRSDTMSQLTENQGTDLQGGLVENVHYIPGKQPGLIAGSFVDSGQAYLNPTFFNIKKQWTFSVGSRDYSEPDQISRCCRDMHRFRGTCYHNKKLVNGRGAFDPGTMSTINNEAKLFLLVFSDNISGVEGSPRLDATSMLTLKST